MLNLKNSLIWNCERLQLSLLMIEASQFQNQTQGSYEQAIKEVI